MDLEDGLKLYRKIAGCCSAGVAVLVHRRHVPNIISPRMYSDRVIALNVQIFGRPFTFIATYVPHAGYSVEDFHTTIDQISAAMSDASRFGAKIVLGGDFNTQLHHGA